MAKKRGTVQKKDLELLVTKIKEVGLLETLTEYSDWDDFEGTELGDAIDSFQIANASVRETLEDICLEKGVEFSFESPDA